MRDIFSSMLNQLMTGQIRVKDIEFKEVEKYAKNKTFLAHKIPIICFVAHI